MLARLRILLELLKQFEAGDFAPYREVTSFKLVL
jgi:hypothetical protein